MNISIDRQYLSVFVACFSVNLLLIFPLVLAGRLYIDDIGRSVWGYLSWDEAGRPLADVVFKQLNLGLPAVNTFPLNQIIAVALVSVACVLLVRQFKISNPFLAAIATLPLGGQPYFLQNLSYAYDSVLMAGSLLLSVAAAIVLLRKTGAGGLLLSFLMLLATLAIYQPAINAFFIVYVFVFLVNSIAPEWNVRAEIAGLIKTVTLAVTVFAVYMVLGTQYLSGDYASNHAEIYALSEMPGGVYQNLATYWEILSGDWRGSVLKKTVILISAVFICLLFFSHIKLLRRAQYLFAFLGVVIALVLLVIFSYGISLVLVAPVWMPRTFIGVGVVITLLNLYVLWYIRQLDTGDKGRRMAGYILGAPVVILGYALVNVAYAYGHSSASQKEFDDIFLARLLYDIDSLSISSGINNAAFIGRSPRSPVLINTIRKYPIIDKLVPLTIDNDRIWGFRLLNTYDSRLRFSSLEPESIELLESGGLEPVRMTMHYSICVAPEQLVVIFTEPDS